MVESVHRHTRAERAESIEHVVDFMVHAARLRQRAYSWEKKRKAIDSGRQVVFFADNDVVILFTEPNRIGPGGARPNEGGYGVIFPDDSSMEATDIAALLGEHIFHKLPSPLLQFTSHAAELGAIIESIARRSNNPPDWRKPPNELMDEQVGTFIEEIKKQDEPSLGAISQAFHDIVQESEPHQREEFANKLLEMLFAPQSASLALVRFLQLLSSQLLLPVEAVSRRAEKLHHIVRQPVTIREMVDLSRATDDWFQRLQKVKYATRNPLTIQRDAQALAYLSYYNSRLKGENAEVCLITGDASIWRLATQYPELREWLIDPRALVIEALDHWSRKHGNGAFKVAVQGILAPFKFDEIVRLSRGSKNIIRRFVTSFGLIKDSAAEVYRTNVEQWATVKNAFLSERLVSEGGYHDLVRAFLRSIENRSVDDIEAGLLSLRTSIDETVAGEWEKLELDFSEIGISFLLAFRDSQTTRRWRPRNPPTIIFDTYTRTDELARTLLRERQGSANLTEKLKQVGSDGATEAEQRYLTFLVYSILAASEGRWSIANVFAQRACAIAEQAKGAEDPSPMDGREALYVRAQAERCLATNSSQLERARHTLAKAREALSKSGGNRKHIKGLRFESEGVALDLSGFHFQTWIENTEVMPERTQEVVRSIECLSATLAEYRREGDEKLVETLGSYCFVNAVQLVHIELRNHRSPSDELRSLCLSLWARYEKALATDANGIYHISYLMASYVTFFRVYFGRKSPEKIFRELRDHITDYCVAEYDKKRYGDLFRRIDKLSNS